MNCAEFQEVLPYIIDSGGSPEEEAHLRSCPVCSDLMQDLKYIADQAKLLVPMEDPSPRVWQGIRSSLEREGLVRPAPVTVRLRPVAVLNPWRWGAAGRLAAFAAVLLVAVGLISYRSREVVRQQPTPGAVTTAAPAVKPAAIVDDDDVQLLAAVQQRAPSMLATYKENLNSVNVYISDAKRSVEQDPEDEQARHYLLQAYDQKALLYQMALSRSLE